MKTSAPVVAVGALLLGAGVWWLRRQGAQLAGTAGALELEEIRVTAQRLPEYAAGDGLDEVTVSASRLPTSALSFVQDTAAEAIEQVKSFFTARGLRNANPGNIERNGIKWRGMAAQQTDPRFIVFEHPSYGVRALGRILTTYEGRGLNTVRKLIGTWAPASENNTSAYAAAVAKALGVGVDQKIDVSAHLPQLAAAITQHENGTNPYSAAELAAWVRMA